MPSVLRVIARLLLLGWQAWYGYFLLSGPACGLRPVRINQLATLSLGYLNESRNRKFIGMSSLTPLGAIGCWNHFL